MAKRVKEPLSADEVLRRLATLEDPEAREGMRRFGIRGTRMLGVSVTPLRRLAREAGRSHALAASLWESGIHEARILASIVDLPEEVTPEQMEAWVSAFDSWDLCDQCCNNLFASTPFAWEKMLAWTGREEEYVRRAGFALMASVAWHDETTPDERFVADCLPAVVRAATDGRNFVKKAVNWALRGIGKRNENLRAAAIAVARALRGEASKSARWIAGDALRELEK